MAPSATFYAHTQKPCNKPPVDRYFKTNYTDASDTDDPDGVKEFQSEIFDSQVLGKTYVSPEKQKTNEYFSSLLNAFDCINNDNRDAISIIFLK